MSNHNLFRDNFAKREVLSLKVKCAAVDLGCSWKGELRDLEVGGADSPVVGQAMLGNIQYAKSDQNLLTNL